MTWYDLDECRTSNQHKHWYMLHITYIDDTPESCVNPTCHLHKGIIVVEGSSLASTINAPVLLLFLVIAAIFNLSQWTLKTWIPSEVGMVIVRWSISFRYYNGLSSGLLSRGALTNAIVSAQQGNLPHLDWETAMLSRATCLICPFSQLPHLPSSLLEAGHVTSFYSNRGLHCPNDFMYHKPTC